MSGGGIMANSTIDPGLGSDDPGLNKLQIEMPVVMAAKAIRLTVITRFHLGGLAAVSPIVDTVVAPLNASSINILAPSMC
jgi:hypothetical protein